MIDSKYQTVLTTPLVSYDSHRKLKLEKMETKITIVLKLWHLIYIKEIRVKNFIDIDTMLLVTLREHPIKFQAKNKNL